MQPLGNCFNDISLANSGWPWGEGQLAVTETAGVYLPMEQDNLPRALSFYEVCAQPDAYVLPFGETRIVLSSFSPTTKLSILPSDGTISEM